MGLFIHWGLYSILGRGEWVMYRERIPEDKYALLADIFNPEFFNPEQWCYEAKKAGMRYMVFTTRHHDGFALFNSRHDRFNSFCTAARRDFVAEYVAACRKYELGVGLYYSLGNWRYGIMKETDSLEKSQNMLQLAHRQVEELMSNYGKIDILWYDGGWCYPSTPENTSEDVRKFWKSEELNSMVRRLQPHILINDRSGTFGDFGTPEGHIPRSHCRQWESCLTMSFDDNSGWGYWNNNIYRKTPAQIIYMLIKAVSMGGNVLLNISPAADGVIPGWQKEILDILGIWMADNSEAVYGVKKSDVSCDINGIQGNSSGLFSEKDNLLYFYILEWPGIETVIPVMKKKVKNAVLLKTGQKLHFEMDSLGRLIIKGLPLNPIDPYCSVIRLETA